MGITELLTVAFVVLKLLGKIDWPWWQVVLPEIIAVAIYFAIFLWSLIDSLSFRWQISRPFKQKGRK
jgi:hypothetical protein